MTFNCVGEVKALFNKWPKCDICILCSSSDFCTVPLEFFNRCNCAILQKWWHWCQWSNPSLSVQLGVGPAIVLLFRIRKRQWRVSVCSNGDGFCGRPSRRCSLAGMLQASSARYWPPSSLSQETDTIYLWNHLLVALISWSSELV